MNTTHSASTLLSMHVSSSHSNNFAVILKSHPVLTLLSSYEYYSPSINSAFMPMSKHFFSRHDGQKRRVFLSTVQLFWNMQRWRFCRNTHTHTKPRSHTLYLITTPTVSPTCQRHDSTCAAKTTAVDLLLWLV